MIQEKYNIKYAAAAVQGQIKRIGNTKAIDADLVNKPLCDLSDEEQEKLIEIGEKSGIKLYYFKNSDRQLPRVNKVLGFLKGIYFESLLDVGSGRGVFLLPFLDEFPYIPVSSIDILDKRIDLLSDPANGGIDQLNVKKADICDQPYADNSFVNSSLQNTSNIDDLIITIEGIRVCLRKHFETPKIIKLFVK